MDEGSTLDAGVAEELPVVTAAEVGTVLRLTVDELVALSTMLGLPVPSGRPATVPDGSVGAGVRSLVARQIVAVDADTGEVAVVGPARAVATLAGAVGRSLLLARNDGRAEVGFGQLHVTPDGGVIEEEIHQGVYAWAPVAESDLRSVIGSAFGLSGLTSPPTTVEPIQLELPSDPGDAVDVSLPDGWEEPQLCSVVSSMTIDGVPASVTWVAEGGRCWSLAPTSEPPGVVANPADPVEVLDEVLRLVTAGREAMGRAT